MSYRDQRRFREQERLSGIMPLTRELGSYVINPWKRERDPLPVIQTADTPVSHLRRKDLWPPEAWAEIESIYRDGEKDVDGTLSSR